VIAALDLLAVAVAVGDWRHVKVQAMAAVVSEEMKYLVVGAAVAVVAVAVAVAVAAAAVVDLASI
jgi:hypothetical protein